MDTAKAPDPEALFNDIAGFIAESRALLKQGAMMELAGLDGRIQILCDEVMRLSGDDRRLYGERLSELLADLTALGEEMAQERQSMANEIRHLAQMKKASVAYRTGDSRDGFGPKEDE